jgi:predicted dehydrogenase
VSENTNKGLSRRDVMKTAGGVAVVSALAGVAIPHVHAAESNTIQLALVGCGGRGTGAAEDALSTRAGPTKLVAMADVFPNRQKDSYKTLTDSGVAKQVDVPDERKFIGFDAYKQAMDVLKPGDVVILTTPPAFRWVHFTYALSKKLNVFMEKPTTVDGPSTRRMLKLAEQSEKSGTKVGVGLMCRHCDARRELYKRLKDDAIGDIVLMRA